MTVRLIFHRLVGHNYQFYVRGNAILFMNDALII